jgi:hypothetical protein
VDVEPFAHKGVGIDSQLQGVGTYEGEGDFRRLPHHFAELAGDGEAFGAVHHGDLDREHIAPGTGNGQSCRHPGHRGPIHRLEEVARTPEPGSHVELIDNEGPGGFGSVSSHPSGHFAEEPTELPLERAHAGLSGVVGDDDPEGAVGEFDVVLGQGGAGHLSTHQVVAGDGHFLVLGVAVEPDDLHAVEQGPGNGVDHVGRRQEQDLRQIQLDFEVVVAERVVLGRVEDLEQGRGGITPVVGADLVHFVEEHHRVHRTGLAQGANQAARLGADVRAAMAPDLGLVADPAEGHPDERAPECAGDGLAERGLAHSRGTDQGQDGAASASADRGQAALHL